MDLDWIWRFRNKYLRLKCQTASYMHFNQIYRNQINPRESVQIRLISSTQVAGGLAHGGFFYAKSPESLSPAHPG